MPKNKDKPKMSDLISRSFTDFSVREDEGDNEDIGHIVGVPIVFEQPTDIGGMYSETIARGAITPDILRDVALFFNHDLNSKPHARTRNGKLRFDIREDGVHMDSDINLRRSDSRDLYEAVKDQTIDGMSFMFRVEDEKWTGLDTDYPSRRIEKIGYVQEVSAVNYPAYKGTSINARSSVDTDKIALDNARATLVDTGDNELELLKEKTKILGGF